MSRGGGGSATTGGCPWGGGGSVRGGPVYVGSGGACGGSCRAASYASSGRCQYASSPPVGLLTFTDGTATGGRRARRRGIPFARGHPGSARARRRRRTH